MSQPLQPRRYLVTGREGQVVQSLIERSAGRSDLTLTAVGRPELDLSRPEMLAAVLDDVKPDLIISAAAYTAVDQAETDEVMAMAVNAEGPGELARLAALRAIPIVHLSTDYVFDGSKDGPYVEADPVSPLGAYGRTKLEGERRVQQMTDNFVILRTAWVYSPYGKNFAKTMLRVAQARDSLTVVDDQVGNPTSALDIADAILAVADNLLTRSVPAQRGIFHMTGTGEASWADFAREIFAVSSANGGSSAEVVSIPTTAYPTPAKRPANSRLDCARLEHTHGVRLPDWRQSTRDIIERLVKAGSYS